MERLKKAEKALNQASRKNGAEAAVLYQTAVARFEKALKSGLTREARLKAYTRKGDCFFQWAQALVSEIHSTPYARLNYSVYQCAMKHAMDLLNVAVDCYKQTSEGLDEWDLDDEAAVNCGQALSLWAELCKPSEKIPLLQSSIQCFRRALEIDPTDTEIQLDMADAYIHLGQAFAESNVPEDSDWIFKEAMRMFDKIYEQTQTGTITGDEHEVVEVLMRWGIGKVTAAEHAEKDVKALYCTEAIQLLRKAVACNPMNCEALNALGDAYEAYAELHRGRASKSLLKHALNDGYKAAKRINKTDIDALIGIAKVSMLMAKLQLKVGNDAKAAQLFTQSMQQYDKALQSSMLTGFYERSETMYDYCCCCALAGRDDIVKTYLEELLHKGGTTVAEICSDKDFGVMHEVVWFQNLIARYCTD